MGEAVQLPHGGLRDGADTRAYERQNFVLRGGLPALPQQDGYAQWEDGHTLQMPLTGARTAYESLARGGGAGPHLTVTGAELGEMTLATSRGPATVPAWLFTLDGYDGPLKQAALLPSKLPEPPVGPVEPIPSSRVLTPIDRLTRIAEDGRSVTVAAAHGSCDTGPAVDALETDDSVVLSAYSTGRNDGPCTAELDKEGVTVQLDRPLDERVLLDAITGRPVPYGGPDDPSPSWSR
ncbi:hypothetical protein ACFQ6U_06425 [Streptomyces sp. NPDC056465]|uniref:hypothetical protein n=1 Tax=Streptomyces sp. NPDC056465 TaxID=3345829 RepID=UPI0036867135